MIARRLLLLLLLAGGPGFAADEDGKAAPEPFDSDSYSGKTVLNEEMAMKIARGRFFNAPPLGTKAPAFELEDADTGEKVSLAELHAEKPVVLFFGSYGCNVARNAFDVLRAVHEDFPDDFEWVMVYIREAHSVNGWNPHLARVVDPSTALQRRGAAIQCREDMGIPFRILVDGIQDPVATRWAAWPLRLFVVDRRGTVVYSGKPGPWGFSPGKGFIAKDAEDLRPHPDRFSQEPLEDFLAGYLERAE